RRELPEVTFVAEPFPGAMEPGRGRIDGAWQAWADHARRPSDSCHPSPVAGVHGMGRRVRRDWAPWPGPGHAAVPGPPSRHRGAPRSRRRTIGDRHGPRRSAKEIAMSTSVPASEATLRRWLRPAPDSMVGCALRRGRPMWSEFMHVLWSLWVFIVPVFVPDGYDRRWWTLTLISYPLFLALYVGSVLAPSRRVAVYALSMVAMCLLLVPWYPSGMSYFMFGCIFLGMARWRNWWSYPLSLLALNAL